MKFDDIISSRPPSVFKILPLLLPRPIVIVYNIEINFLYLYYD